nr:IS200/IS605 family transposase [Escherichia fergusonii]
MILWSMKKETDIRRGRHCVFLMHVHLVFVTKYRRQIFDHDAIEKLRTYFSNVCADFEAELVEMDGEPDHVHLLINYPPKLAISSLVNSLKGVSSKVTETRSTRYCSQVLLQRRFVESQLFCQ